MYQVKGKQVKPAHGVLNMESMNRDVVKVIIQSLMLNVMNYARLMMVILMINHFIMKCKSQIMLTRLLVTKANTYGVLVTLDTEQMNNGSKRN